MSKLATQRPKQTGEGTGSSTLGPALADGFARAHNDEPACRVHVDHSIGELPSDVI